MHCRAACATILVTAALAAAAHAQTPQPFPKPGDPGRPQPGAPAPQPAQPITKGAAPLPAPAAPASPADQPSEQMLGLPIYPGAQFLTSYDAGRGQRYYLFGANTEFLQAVSYYRTMLKQRGDLVYEQPPIHMFEVGRFREETMAFPPGVTIKDYAWGGSEGYLHVRPGAPPARYRVVIQIVPVPPATKGP